MMEPRVNVRDSSSPGRLALPMIYPLDRPLPDVNGFKAARHSLALALGFLLLPLAAHRALAQQPTQWPQDDSYNGQYPPDQQPNYGQQGYPQPQSGYPQRNYPRQGDAQQAYLDAPQQYPQPWNGQQAQPINAEELEQIVAPIALYPDAVLAQILAASTYPAQIAAADQWLRRMGNATPDQVAAGATAQTDWDPSVKALTAFPQVLSMLDRNLQWTSTLGNAYYNQPQDV